MEPGLTAGKDLLRDRLHHIDMLELLRRGLADVVYESPEGLLLYSAEGECWVLTAATPEESRKMLKIPETLDFVCAHQAFTVAQLRERYDVGFSLNCLQAAYFGKEPLEVPAVCELRRMAPGDAAWVNANYRNLPEEFDYVLDRLERGLVVGAYVDGRCAGFVSRHSEGSIGMLKVLPEYRRRGIGSALFRDAINRELLLGNVPYSQAEWDNEPSLALHREVGCEISADHVYWLKLESRV